MAKSYKKYKKRGGAPLENTQVPVEPDVVADVPPQENMPSQESDEAESPPEQDAVAESPKTDMTSQESNVAVSPPEEAVVEEAAEAAPEAAAVEPPPVSNAQVTNNVKNNAQLRQEINKEISNKQQLINEKERKRTELNDRLVKIREEPIIQEITEIEEELKQLRLELADLKIKVKEIDEMEIKKITQNGGSRRKHHKKTKHVKSKRNKSKRKKSKSKNSKKNYKGGKLPRVFTEDGWRGK